MLSSSRYPLHNIVLDDLFANNKVLLLLLFLVLLSALSTIWITHHTRLLITEKGNLVIQQQALDNEFVNLTLEENTYSHNVIIEKKANALGMQTVKPEQEVLILE